MQCRYVIMCHIIYSIQVTATLGSSIKSLTGVMAWKHLDKYMSNKKQNIHINCKIWLCCYIPGMHRHAHIKFVTDGYKWDPSHQPMMSLEWYYESFISYNNSYTNIQEGQQYVGILILGWFPYSNNFTWLLIWINVPLTRYAKLRIAHAPGMPRTFSSPPTSKKTASQRSRHASRHVRHACAVMYVGIAHPRWR